MDLPQFQPQRTRHYLLYGLTTECNIFIPGALPYLMRNGQTPDVRISVGAFPESVLKALGGRRSSYPAIERPGQGPTSALLLSTLSDGNYFHFQYEGEIDFICDRAGTQIWTTWSTHLTADDAAIYLLGPVFSFLLRLRGIACLHASCIVVAGRAVAIVGASGAGKSTLVAALASRGATAISDDVLPLIHSSSTLLAVPSYPRLRLWPSSVECLFGNPDALPKLTTRGRKCYLDLMSDQYSFDTAPVPLHAIYVLGPRRNIQGRPVIKPESPQHGLMSLIANSYHGHCLEKAMRADEFRMFSLIAARLPISRVFPHSDITRIAVLCNMIVSDLTRDFSGQGLDLHHLQRSESRAPNAI